MVFASMTNPSLAQKKLLTRAGQEAPLAEIIPSRTGIMSPMIGCRALASLTGLALKGPMVFLRIMNDHTENVNPISMIFRAK
jgi:hypothetical protein